MNRRQHSSSGHCERKKRTHLTAVGSSGTFGACCGPWAGSSCTRRAFCLSGVARAAPVEHSAVLGQTRAAVAAPVAHYYYVAPGQTRAALFEYSAAQGPARAAISSHLRPQAKLEQPNATNSGISRAKAKALKRPKPETAKKTLRVDMAQNLNGQSRGAWIASVRRL